VKAQAEYDAKIKRNGNKKTGSSVKQQSAMNLLKECEQTKDSVFEKSRNQMMDLYEEIFAAEGLRVKTVTKVLVSHSIINKSMHDGNSQVQKALTDAMDENDIKTDMATFRSTLVRSIITNLF
jgi:hypothetical protein